MLTAALAFYSHHPLCKAALAAHRTLAHCLIATHGHSPRTAPSPLFHRLSARIPSTHGRWAHDHRPLSTRPTAEGHTPTGRGLSTPSCRHRAMSMPKGAVACLFSAQIVGYSLASGFLLSFKWFLFSRRSRKFRRGCALFQDHTRSARQPSEKLTSVPSAKSARE